MDFKKLNVFPKAWGIVKSGGRAVKSGGRTTTFLIFFTGAGTLLHIWHRLDTTFIGFITTIMTFVLGHSVKEDYFAPDPDNKKDDATVPPTPAAEDPNK